MVWLLPFQSTQFSFSGFLHWSCMDLFNLFEQIGPWHFGFGSLTLPSPHWAPSQQVFMLEHPHSPTGMHFAGFMRHNFTGWSSQWLPQMTSPSTPSASFSLQHSDVSLHSFPKALHVFSSSLIGLITSSTPPPPFTSSECISRVTPRRRCSLMLTLPDGLLLINWMHLLGECH